MTLRKNSYRGVHSAQGSLKTLILSRNFLQGQLRRSRTNCTSLEVLIVGNNKIEDAFPCMLGNISSLHVLLLRSNKFHGELYCRETNGSWHNLQIIEIAQNSFTGHLSSGSFLGWRGMMLTDTARNETDHLLFGIDYGDWYYEESETVTMKVAEYELENILTIFTAIDFSGNNFSGERPNTIGNTSSLYILNLSHNSFTGKIPRSFGKLTELGSLDLSKNKPTGEIPKELTSLTFLSVLNLAYNRLFEMIPTGNQFHTFSAASYEGNKGLCGFPLNKRCDDSNATVPMPAPSSNESPLDSRYILSAIGFADGLALVMAPLAFSKRWNEYLDHFSEKLLTFVRSCRH